jgi:hypothetical protein
MLIGCGSPTHLQYDHGRASAQAFGTQGDRSRPEVADAAHPLQGTEALAIRDRAIEQTSDAESGKAEFVKDTSVD